MNREERRKRERQIAKDPMAKKCPICGKKSLFVAVPTKNHLCDIKCELCNGTIAKDSNTAIPFTYC
jgi:transcription elongation factor Elf1